MKNSGPIDFLILAPLPEEIEALCEIFCAAKSGRMLLRDDIEYYDTTMPTIANDEVRVRIVTLPKQGVLRAAVVATRLILTWRPKCIVSFGIAGKVATDVQIGDVLVADEVFYYEPAKESSPKSEDPRSARQAAARHFATSTDFKSASLAARLSINEPWFRVYDAMVASGEKKIAGENAPSRKAIADHDRETHILEMEAAGVGGAVAGVGPECKPLWLVVKGVCDNASSDEADRNRETASEEAKKARLAARKLAAERGARVLRSLLEQWIPHGTSIPNQDINPVRALAKKLAQSFPTSLVDSIEELTWARTLRDPSTLPAIHYHWVIKHPHVHWLDFCYLLMLRRAQDIGVPVHLLVNDEDISDPDWRQRTASVIQAVFNGNAQVSWYTAVRAKYHIYAAYASLNGFDQVAREQLGKTYGTPEEQLRAEGYDPWLAYVSWCAAITRRCVLLAWTDSASRYERIRQDISLDPLIVKRPTLTLNGVPGKRSEPGASLFIDPPLYTTILGWINTMPDARYVNDLARYLTLGQDCYKNNIGTLDKSASELLRPWTRLEGVLRELPPDHEFCTATCRLLSAMADWNQRFFQD